MNEYERQKAGAEDREAFEKWLYSERGRAGKGDARERFEIYKLVQASEAKPDRVNQDDLLGKSRTLQNILFSVVHAQRMGVAASKIEQADILADLDKQTEKMPAALREKLRAVTEQAIGHVADGARGQADQLIRETALKLSEELPRTWDEPTDGRTTEDIMARIPRA
jgi:hypothetical protein